MQKISEENRTIVSPIRVLRKLLEDESMQYDKTCQTCKHQGLIALWDVKARKYKTYRCPSMKCKYGNLGIATKLPELGFEI
jgi:hypothetical protein